MDRNPFRGDRLAEVYERLHHPLAVWPGRIMDPHADRMIDHLGGYPDRCVHRRPLDIECESCKKYMAIEG